MDKQKNAVRFGFAHDEIAFRVVGGTVKVLERVRLGVARVVLQTHPWFGRYNLMGQAGKWLGLLVFSRRGTENVWNREQTVYCWKKIEREIAAGAERVV